MAQQWDLNVQLTSTQHQMHQALSQCQGYTVSNNSFKDEAGVAAWIIEELTAETQIIKMVHTGPTFQP